MTSELVSAASQGLVKSVELGAIDGAQLKSVARPRTVESTLVGDAALGRSCVPPSAAEPPLDELAGVVVELNPSLPPSAAEGCWEAKRASPRTEKTRRHHERRRTRGACEVPAEVLQKKSRGGLAVAKRLEAAYVSPWRHGGLRAIGPVRVDVAMPRCQGRSFKHATDADFAEQKALAEKVMDWYLPRK